MFTKKVLASLACGGLVAAATAGGLMTKLPRVLWVGLDTPAFIVGVLVSGNAHRPNEAAYLLTEFLIVCGLVYRALIGLDRLRRRR